MAYLRSVAVPGCNSCGRQSVKELISYRNVSLGYYCVRHVDRALKTQKLSEAAGTLPVQARG